MQVLAARIERPVVPGLLHGAYAAFVAEKTRWAAAVCVAQLLLLLWCLGDCRQLVSSQQYDR
jgi:hypothetical protein